MEALLRSVFRVCRSASAPGKQAARRVGLPFAREDSDGRPVAGIETLDVELRRLADVDLPFAIDEGEGFETVAAWRRAHVR